MNNINKDESSDPSFPYLYFRMNMYVPLGMYYRLPAPGFKGLTPALPAESAIPMTIGRRRRRDAYSFIPVDFSLYSLGVMPVRLLKIELNVVFELKPASKAIASIVNL